MAIKSLKYAGIGPRATPPDICHMMFTVAKQLDAQRWILRSGRARGADQAWESGSHPDNSEIYIPWHGFNTPTQFGTPRSRFILSPNTAEIQALARNAVPHWEHLSDGGKLLQMRNISILLGHNLNDPVEFVAYWSEQRTAQGGTGNAIRMAQIQGIPTFNIGFLDEQEAMNAFIEEVTA